MSVNLSAESIITCRERDRKAKVILGKKSKAGSIAISDFKVYYKAITIKMAWYWNNNNNKNVDQWNRVEAVKLPQTYSNI